MKAEYPDSKSDLFAAFIERCTDLAGPQGVAAMITMQSWMFLSSYEKLRKSLLSKQWITSMLHLGPHAFDSIGGEVVSSTAFVLTNLPSDSRSSARKRSGIFIRLVDGKSEAAKIAALKIALEVRSKESGFYPSRAGDFMVVPNSPIVYWLSEKMRISFATGRPLSEVANVRQGLATADNDRFLRQWWEVAATRTAFSCTSREEAAVSDRRWFPYNKGGDFRRWYGNHEHVVNWEQDGAEIRAFGTEMGGKPRSRPQNTHTYFSPSVSWSDISSGAPSFRSFPNGFIHGNKGNSIFGDSTLLTRLLGVMNASCVTLILEALTPTMTASVGDVAKSPIPDILDNLPTSSIISLEAMSKADWDCSETSWDFDSNPLISSSLEHHSATN